MFDKEYIQYGFLQGDGGLGRLSSPSHLGLEVNIGCNDEDIFSLFEIPVNFNKRSFYMAGYNEELRRLGFSSESLPYRLLPLTFSKWQEIQKISFLRGMYSANGSVLVYKNRGTPSIRITFKGTCKEMICQLKLVLESLNYHPYITTNKSKAVDFANGTFICKESYDLNLGRQNEINRFVQEIGFEQKYKMDKAHDFFEKKETNDETRESIQFKEIRQTSEKI